VKDTRTLLAKITEGTSIFNPEEILLRTCGSCEQEFGQIPIPTGYGKTHSFCTRHMALVWPKGKNPSPQTAIPDLAKLPPKERQDWRVATIPINANDPALN
jgi:hypothetical protein